MDVCTDRLYVNGEKMGDLQFDERDLTNVSGMR